MYRMGIEEMKEESLSLKIQKLLKLGGNSSVLQCLMLLAESTENVLIEVLVLGMKQLVF